MASYSIGDESDDEFDLQRQRRGQQQQHQRGGSGSGFGASASNSRQAHQYVDPFEDDYATGGGIAGPSTNANSSIDGASGRLGQPRSYDDALIFDDFTGGKPANPMGTASDVQKPLDGGNFNRYDVYEE